MKNYHLTLGMAETLRIEPFEIVAQDIGANQLIITLVEDGSLEPYVIETEQQVIMYVKHSDNTRYQQYATVVDGPAGKIEIVLDTDMIAVGGKTFAEIAVYDGEDLKATSQLFGYLIRKNLNDSDTVVSGNDLPNYRSEMLRLETILNNLVITSGDSNPEIVAARYSILEGVSFTTLGDRLDFMEEKQGGGSADQIDYDNEISELAATNVQAAIDENAQNYETHLADKATESALGHVKVDGLTIGIDGEGLIKLNFPDSAGAHNSIYRGKYLGTSYTAAQQAAVADGTFEDLYIGDYWTIGGVNYRIAAFNYFRNVGDTSLSSNHITIVPDTTLYTAQMNKTNITTGGYVGSKMRTENLAAAISTIEAAFPGRVIQHNQILVNATTDGKASGWAWTSGKVELMNEVMVYGTGAWGVSSIGNGYNVASSNGRLPLFNFRQDLVNTRQSYWLRDVVSATLFALVHAGGRAHHAIASNSDGVRPAFSIS